MGRINNSIILLPLLDWASRQCLSVASGTFHGADNSLGHCFTDSRHIICFLCRNRESSTTNTPLWEVHINIIALNDTDTVSVSAAGKLCWVCDLAGKAAQGTRCLNKHLSGGTETFVQAAHTLLDVPHTLIIMTVDLLLPDLLITQSREELLSGSRGSSGGKEVELTHLLVIFRHGKSFFF